MRYDQKENTILLHLLCRPFHISPQQEFPDSGLVLFQLFQGKKALNCQFREIKFPANTIFLCDREIKDS